MARGKIGRRITNLTFAVLAGTALVGTLATCEGKDTLRSQSTAGTPGSAGIPELLEDNWCFACHDITEMRLGPPFSMIAVRHAERKNMMAEVLAQKIVFGGGGNWGSVPMVANKHVTVDEARAMAQWILSLEVNP